MRFSLALAAGVLATLVGTGAALADEAGEVDGRLRLSGFFGVRTFSSSAALGTPTTTSLSNSVLFGARAGRELLWPWLTVEAELPLAITTSRDDQATIFFTEPRAQLVVERRLQSWLRPFAVVGAGAAMAASSDRGQLASGVQPTWYLGGGVKLDRSRGISLRVDLRVPVVPARGDALFTPELELFVSVYRYTGERRAPAALVVDSLDSDDDGVDDDVDQCIGRPEDVDGFEDLDGCPDIDDDRDEVLDIADRCRLEPEDWNGYRDDDGCPDSVPTELQAFEGVLAGVRFRPASAVMSRRSHKILDKLAAALVTYPSVRGRITGHTDDSGDPEANLDLSTRRAEAVKYYLVARGVAEHRLAAVGVGAAAPLEANDDRKGRAANRRVEFHIRRRDQ